MATTTLTRTPLPALRRPALPLRAAGAAGLGYVIAAGVENMELLRAPLQGAAAADIRAGYVDAALVAATALAGVVSLLLYAAFAWVLAPRLRRPRVALAAGLAGPALAFAGIVASLPLVLGADGLSDGEATAAYELQHTLRVLAGPLMAVFLACAAGGGVLPRPLTAPGYAIAAALALTPVAAVGDVHALQLAATLAFSLHALWIWLASAWLLAGGVAPAELVRRVAFLMLVLTAGLVGLALLALPRATAAFFAWELGPASLAAFSGGVYVGSAVVYAAALRAPWRAVRPLVGAAVVLSVSVLCATLLHLDRFDLDRLQAWAWLVLFAAFALVTTGLLAVGGRPAARGPRPEPAVRALLGATGLALLAAGAGLWIDPGPLSPLGARFAGAWSLMLGTLAAWTALDARRGELRLTGLALVALPAGALAGALRAGVPEPALAAALVLPVAAGVVALGSR